MLIFCSLVLFRITYIDYLKIIFFILIIVSHYLKIDRIFYTYNNTNYLSLTIKKKHTHTHIFIVLINKVKNDY